MEIKKLTQIELDEGLTLEFVNNIKFDKRQSPVLFSKDEEPVNLMKCSTGFWRSIGNCQYERDTKGNLVVYDNKTCCIARARYLLHHAEDEKKQDAEKVLQSRKKKIEDSLSDIEKKIEQLKKLRDNGNQKSSLEQTLESALLSQTSEWQRAQYLREREAKEKQTQELIAHIPRLEEIYNELKSEFDKGNYNMALDALNIEKIVNPMTFRFDNENEMNQVKAFTRTLIETGDINLAYARLKVEQE